MFRLSSSLLTDIHLLLKVYDFEQPLQGTLYTPGFSDSILSFGFPRIYLIVIDGLHMDLILCFREILPILSVTPSIYGRVV